MSLYTQTLDRAIRKCEVKDAKTGVHYITYKDIDGHTVKQTIKGTPDDVNKRVKELKEHDCKVLKTEMFTNWKDAAPRKSRDGNPFQVDKVLKSAKSVNGQTYYVVQSGKWYVCTADKTGKHGGVFSLSLSDAMRDLKSWLKMDELKKKYGPNKWYSKWLHGEE